MLKKLFGMKSEKSLDFTASESIKKIKSMAKAGDVKSFVKGDGRKTVCEAAESQIDTLKSAKEKKKDKKDTDSKKEKKTASAR
jgi:hypothetical protein